MSSDILKLLANRVFLEFTVPDIVIRNSQLNIDINDIQPFVARSYASGF